MRAIRSTQRLSNAPIYLAAINGESSKQKGTILSMKLDQVRSALGNKAHLTFFAGHEESSPIKTETSEVHVVKDETQDFFFIVDDPSEISEAPSTFTKRQGKRGVFDSLENTLAPSSALFAADSSYSTSAFKHTPTPKRSRLSVFMQEDPSSLSEFCSSVFFIATNGQRGALVREGLHHLGIKDSSIYNFHPKGAFDVDSEEVWHELDSVFLASGWESPANATPYHWQRGVVLVDDCQSLRCKKTVEVVRSKHRERQPTSLNSPSSKDKKSIDPVHQMKIPSIDLQQPEHIAIYNYRVVKSVSKRRSRTLTDPKVDEWQALKRENLLFLFSFD